MTATTNADGADQVAARLQALADRLAARRRWPHAVVGVEHGGQRWVVAAGRARPDGAAMTPDTPFFLASVTKLAIAACVLGLVEDGRLGLDDRLLDRLPRARGVHRRRGEDRTRDLTLRHLLAHTSGLADYLDDAAKRRPSLYERIARGEEAAWALDDVIALVRDELPARFAPLDPTAPKARARYSDTNYQLLIGVVEEATGQGFGDVVAERLLRPLGMRATHLPGATEPLDPAPAPATPWTDAGALEAPATMASWRDLVGTADDTLTLLGGVLRGEAFADPATAGLMREHWHRLLRPPAHYGLGLMRARVNRVVAPGRRPLTLLGHTGATGSWAWHCPELGLSTVGTVDHLRARAAPFRVMPRLLRAVVG